MSIYLWLWLLSRLVYAFCIFYITYNAFLGNHFMFQIYRRRLNLFYKDKIKMTWPLLVYFDCYWHRCKKYIIIVPFLYLIAISIVHGLLFHFNIIFFELTIETSYIDQLLAFLLPIIINLLFILLFFWLIWKRRKSLKTEEISLKSFELIKIDENEKFDFNFIVQHRKPSFCKKFQKSLIFSNLKDKEIKKYSKNKIDDNVKYFLILLLCIKASRILEKYEQYYPRKELLILQGSKEFTPQELADYFYRYIIKEITELK